MLGNEIKRERTLAGFVGQLVCREARISRSRLSDIEREHVKPSPSEVQRIKGAIKKLKCARERVAKVAQKVGWPLL